MNTRLAALLLVATGLLAAGCAPRRGGIDAPPPVFTGVPPPARPGDVPAATVMVTEEALVNRKFRQLGLIEVSMRKLAADQRDPSRELANEALTERARALGADAVIRVVYTSGIGIGIGPWGYIEARGMAVKLLD